MNNPLVTIITPCYNHEEYLEDYFESILNQTYYNVELILFDDASSDKSQMVIENYLDRLKERFIRLVYMPRKKNIGLIKNLQEGLKLAQGAYIITFASDDIMLPKRIEENVRFLEENEKFAMVYSDGYLFSNKDNMKKKFKKTFSNFFKNTSYGNIKDSLILFNFIPAPTVCIRKECLKAVGGYNDDFVFEDYDLWLRIAENYQIGYLNLKLVFYRVHDSSLSHSPEKQLIQLDSERKMLKQKQLSGKYSDLIICNAFNYLYTRYANYYFDIKEIDLFNEYYNRIRKPKLKLTIKKFYLSLKRK